MSYMKRLAERIEEISREEDLDKNRELVDEFLNSGDMSILSDELRNVIIEWEHDEIEHSSDFPPLPEDYNE